MRPKQSERKKVVLTDVQRELLEPLWFVYGDHGPKSMTENHDLIQGLIGREADERDCYRPTRECLASIDVVLGREQGGGR